jgi:hypothetical protein
MEQGIVVCEEWGKDVIVVVFVVESCLFVKV